jgi:hypothetical protein
MSKEEDSFEAAINAAFANSASATIQVDLSKATLSDLLLHSPIDSPKKLPYPRSLTSGLIAAKCIPSSTLVHTLPSPMPATPTIGQQVSLKSISQSKMDEMSFADQFFERGSSPSASKRIRFEAKEAISSFSAKASEEAPHSAGSEASPFTSLFKEAPLFQFARTQSNESNASNVSGRSYFSMAAVSSFTGGGGEAKAPAGK